MSVPLPPFDEDVPALHTLLGPEARELMAAIVASSGENLRSITATQVRYVPGKSVTVHYRIDVQTSDGRSHVRTYVAASGITVPPGTAIVEGDGVRIAVWRFPHDPFLPGLALATDPAAAAELLEQVGARSGRPRLRTRAYRGGRRAVVEVTTGSDRVFLKVLRPAKVEELQRKHVALAGHVPVPHSHGWTEDQGIVVLQAMPGRTLRKAIESGTRRLPGAAQLIELLDRFPDPGSEATVVSTPIERAQSHAAMLATLLPPATDRLRRLVRRMSATSPEKGVAAHGDYHASQVMVRGAEVVGLVDVDTAGIGERSSDLANLLGHLSTLGLVSSARKNIDRYGRELIDGFGAVTDPVGLRIRVAATVLGLATGPFRVQAKAWPQQTMQRIELAEQWIAAAEPSGDTPIQR